MGGESNAKQNSRHGVTSERSERLKTSASPHIDEYFADVHEDAQEKAGRELFTADSENIDVRTELNGTEIYYINAMYMYDDVLRSYGLKDVFRDFYESYFRLKISKDRKSRGEYVSVSRSDRSEDIQEGMKTASSMFGGK